VDADLSPGRVAVSIEAAGLVDDSTGEGIYYADATGPRRRRPPTWKSRQAGGGGWDVRRAGAALRQGGQEEQMRGRLLGRFGSINNSWGPSGASSEESGLG